MTNPGRSPSCLPVAALSSAAGKLAGGVAPPAAFSDKGFGGALLGRPGFLERAVQLGVHERHGLLLRRPDGTVGAEHDARGAIRALQRPDRTEARVAVVLEPHDRVFAEAGGLRRVVHRPAQRDPRHLALRGCDHLPPLLCTPSFAVNIQKVVLIGEPFMVIITPSTAPKHHILVPGSPEYGS